MMGEDSYRYIRLKVVGSGSYTGTIYSNMTAGRVGSDATPLTAIDSITGNAQVGKTLTVGALTPLGSTATYQWVRCQTSNGSYSSIQGATSSTYTLTLDDYGYNIEVVVNRLGLLLGSDYKQRKRPCNCNSNNGY